MLAKEEDTVAVGQDLYTLDTDAKPASGAPKSERQLLVGLKTLIAFALGESGSGEEEAASPPKQEEKEAKKSDEQGQGSQEGENDEKSGSPSPSSGESETIKVPQMAESISEGTLKTWMKKVGDHVEADEEIASIETDKVLIHFYFAARLKEADYSVVAH